MVPSYVVLVNSRWRTQPGIRRHGETYGGKNNGKVVPPEGTDEPKAGDEAEDQGNDDEDIGGSCETNNGRAPVALVSSHGSGSGKSGMNVGSENEGSAGRLVRLEGSSRMKPWPEEEDTWETNTVGDIMAEKGGLVGLAAIDEADESTRVSIGDGAAERVSGSDGGATVSPKRV